MDAWHQNTLGTLPLYEPKKESHAFFPTKPGAIPENNLKGSEHVT